MLRGVFNLSHNTTFFKLLTFFMQFLFTFDTNTCLLNQSTLCMKFQPAIRIYNKCFLQPLCSLTIPYGMRWYNNALDNWRLSLSKYKLIEIQTDALKSFVKHTKQFAKYWIIDNESTFYALNTSEFFSGVNTKGYVYSWTFWKSYEKKGKFWNSSKSVSKMLLIFMCFFKFYIKFVDNKIFISIILKFPMRVIWFLKNNVVQPYEYTLRSFAERVIVWIQINIHKTIATLIWNRSKIHC